MVASIKKKIHKQKISLHLMMIPAVVIAFIFCYLPMYGIVFAFQKYVPALGLFGSQQWVGMLNFEWMFTNPKFWPVVGNTVIISVGKIVLGTILPIVFALLLNEVGSKVFKRSVQTIVYFPYFLSWVVFSGILINILSPSSGLVNRFLGIFGVDPIFFLGDSNHFQMTIIVTSEIKNFGFNMIIYLASIAGIDSTLYEAATIDGAGYMRRMWHITLPGIRTMIGLLFVLSLGNLLNAGFDQVWSLLNSGVLDKGEILDTWIYRSYLTSSAYRFSQSTAIGLVKSIVSLVLISGSYLFTYKVFNYKLF